MTRWLLSGLAVALVTAQIAAAAPPALDAKAVEAFSDSQIIPALKQSGVPGAVVVIVRRNGTVLAKGYGVSDVVRRTPVDASRTLFDTASIGKTMTAVIAQQLIDEGRLDPDADVNRYLTSAKVTGARVTLRMLLGHRGGFDSDLTDLFVPLGSSTAMSTGELDRRLRPVAEPGRVTAYDNQGFGVIGLMLRDVTGKPFPRLFRDSLFGPLGMNAVQGAPDDGDARLARCYVVRGPGATDRCPYWLYRDGLRGAGGVAASGADMALYMRMLLNGGVLDGHRILSPRAFAALTDFDDYRFNPGLPGMGRDYVQFEEFRGTEYAHGGSMPGFSSIMTIYAGADVGIFVSYLGGQLPSFDFRLNNLFVDWRSQVTPGARPGFAALDGFTKRFAERFIPADVPRSSTGKSSMPAGPTVPISDLAGTYYPAEHESLSLGPRMMGWLSGFSVAVSGDGALRVVGTGPYKPIGTNLFEDKTGQRIAFAELYGHRYMAFHVSPGVFLQKNWLEAPAWSLLLFPATLLVILTSVFYLRRSTPSDLKRLARLSLAGLGLVILGLICELQFGRSLYLVEGDVILTLLWRIAAWGGAAALLFGSAIFLWRRSDGVGRWRLAHGLTISIASAAMAAIWLLWTVPTAWTI